MSHDIRISKAREVVAYSELWHSAGVLLELGRSRSDATFPLYLASSLFSAFAFEAFLNHIGAAVFESWPTIERSLSPEGKQTLICERLKLLIDKGGEPWQSIRTLLARRNSVAHGRNQALEAEQVASLADYELHLQQGLYADWESLGTEKVASDVRVHLRNAMSSIHAAAGLPNDELFALGFGSGSATLVSVPLSAFSQGSATP